MTKLLNLPNDDLMLPRAHGFCDDFEWAVTVHRWTSVLTDSGTATVGDAVGGIVALVPSDGSVADNDEAYLKSSNETFKFAANKPIYMAARVQFTEANTDDANIIVGLKDAVAANTLVDNGGGPPSSYSGVCFFKEDGQTVWSVENSISTTQKTTQLTADNSLDGIAKTAGSSGYQVLEIEWQPTSSTLGDFTFKIDGVIVAKHKDQVYTNATEMQVCLGVKNGDTNNETLNCDYVIARQAR